MPVDRYNLGRLQPAPHHLEVVVRVKVESEFQANAEIQAETQAPCQP